MSLCIILCQVQPGLLVSPVGPLSCSFLSLVLFYLCLLCAFFIYVLCCKFINAYIKNRGLMSLSITFFAWKHKKSNSTIYFGKREDSNRCRQHYKLDAVPEVSLQVGEASFRIFTSLKKLSRIENSNQHGALVRGCNVLLTKADDSGTC